MNLLGGGTISCAVKEDRPPNYLKVKLLLYKGGDLCFTSLVEYNPATASELDVWWYTEEGYPIDTAYLSGICGQGEYTMVGLAYARNGSSWYGGPLSMDYNEGMWLADPFYKYAPPNHP